MKSDKGQIGLAGEFRVASELLRRGYSAHVTYGNAKATDIIVLGTRNRFIRVEVKTSKNNRNFVTGYFPKYSCDNDLAPAPDLWVLFLPNEKKPEGDTFFLLTHKEIRELQILANNGKETKKGEGVDNIPLKILLEKRPDSKNRWELIDKLIK